jgi:TldD protein
MTTTATDNALEIARRNILAPSGLGRPRFEQTAGGILGHAVDSADLYFQASHQESWSLEDGIVKDGSHSIEQGVGVRAVAGDRSGFAYSDEIVLPALTQASEAARAIARRGRRRRRAGVGRKVRTRPLSAARSAGDAVRR